MVFFFLMYIEASIITHYAIEYVQLCIEMYFIDNFRGDTPRRALLLKCEKVANREVPVGEENLNTPLSL